MNYNNDLKNNCSPNCNSNRDSKRFKKSNDQKHWNFNILKDNVNSLPFLNEMDLNVIEDDTSASEKKKSPKSVKSAEEDLSNSENEIYDRTLVNDSASKDSDILDKERPTIEIYADNDDIAMPKNNILSSTSTSKQILRCQNININNKKLSRSPFSPIFELNKNSVESDLKNTIISTTSDEIFFLYRKKVPKKNTDDASFNKLSDEMVLQIFKWLPKKTLIRCSSVCHRFNRVAQDESLWTRFDLGGRTLRSGSISKIISRGVIILRLAQAEIKDPILDYTTYSALLNTQAKLQYLDLSMCVISKSSLKELLSKCRNLKKLSLEHVPLDSGICNEISENINIESLNMTMCEGLDYLGINVIINKLQSLKNLNISWTSLTVNSIEAIIENITPELLRLNIAGCRKSMTDNYLKLLVKRCPNLIELDLSDCTLLTYASIENICKLEDLEYLSLSRCYCINLSSYLSLKSMISLQYLDVFGLLSEQAITALQESLPDVGINRFTYSAVARPTVGSRRTSIWGLRTRD